MGDLNEIVSVAAVSRLFVWLAIALPIVGAGVGAVWAARKGSVRTGLLRGLTIGLIGPLNLVLWRVYNAITDRNGLDTVSNLAINLGLFVLVGAALGLVFGRSAREEPAEAQSGEVGATDVPEPEPGA